MSFWNLPHSRDGVPHLPVVSTQPSVACLIASQGGPPSVVDMSLYITSRLFASWKCVFVGYRLCPFSAEVKSSLLPLVPSAESSANSSPRPMKCGPVFGFSVYDL